MVRMDKQDYLNKSNHFFSQPAYRSIPRDPTNKIKTKLINILKRVKIGPLDLSSRQPKQAQFT